MALIILVSGLIFLIILVQREKRSKATNSIVAFVGSAYALVGVCMLALGISGLISGMHGGPS